MDIHRLAVGDLKNPGAQVAVRTACHKVVQQAKKRFLDYVACIVVKQTETAKISKQRGIHLLIEIHYSFLHCIAVPLFRRGPPVVL
jgi:hypothetical protein